MSAKSSIETIQAKDQLCSRMRSEAERGGRLTHQSHLNLIPGGSTVAIGIEDAKGLLGGLEVGEQARYVGQFDLGFADSEGIVDLNRYQRRAKDEFLEVDKGVPRKNRREEPNILDEREHESCWQMRGQR